MQRLDGVDSGTYEPSADCFNVKFNQVQILTARMRMGNAVLSSAVHRLCTKAGTLIVFDSVCAFNIH